MAKTKEIEVRDTEMKDVALSGDLSLQVAQEQKKREILAKYVRDNMVSGTDFYSLKIGGRETKPSLSKPGSEKVLSLFHWRAEFTKDADTWEMLGSIPGILCYVCKLYTIKDSVLVGEGRGARDSKKDGGDANKAIKMAEKSAQIDAVLRTGGLSDLFTQDVEDMQEEKPRMAPYQIPRKVEAADDEAQGKRYQYPQMTKENDASGLPKKEPAKDTVIIKELLSQLGKPAESAKEAIMFIQMLTGGLLKGIKWVPGSNDSEVIAKLRSINEMRLNGKEMWEEAMDDALSKE